MKVDFASLLCIGSNMKYSTGQWQTVHMYIIHATLNHRITKISHKMVMDDPIDVIFEEKTSYIFISCLLTTYELARNTNQNEQQERSR